jgi:hypothetical protein
MIEKHQVVQLLALVQLLNPKCNGYNLERVKNNENKLIFQKIKIKVKIQLKIFQAPKLEKVN